MQPVFVHLHLHTEYSLVDGIVRIEPLVEAAAQAGMPAVAVTDQCNLFAMVKFYRAAQARGIKPIIGVELWVQGDTGADSRGASPLHRLVLLCQSDTGYRNLTRLVSRSYTEGQQRGIPIVHKDWMTGSSEGLIALSGGRMGDIGQALLGRQPALAESLLAAWQALFPNRFYLELQRTGRAGEEDYIHAAVELALATNTPVVATNDVRFLKADEYEAHEVRVCIHEGRLLADPRRPRQYSAQQYLRSAAEMAELFADIPEAIENSVRIAERCNLELRLGQNYLPDFPLPEGVDLEEHLRQQAKLGLEGRLSTHPPEAGDAAAYYQR
ncbi:MAG TPA: PHP domain-containing protein, partial [Gammaproteobacteria bacterium]|nr:PHP domain-containing protein [Gammaproteobacteria bacterium]